MDGSPTQAAVKHRFNQKVWLSATQTVPPIMTILLHKRHFSSYLLIRPQKPPKRPPQGNYLESYSWIFRTRQYPKCNDPYLLQGQQINKPQHGVYTPSHSSCAVSHEETSPPGASCHSLTKESAAGPRELSCVEVKNQHLHAADASFPLGKGKPPKNPDKTSVIMQPQKTTLVPSTI